MADARPQKIDVYEEELSDLLMCLICHNVCDNPKILFCQHMYCAECIGKWIKEKEGQLWCPECNQEQTLPQGGAKSLPQALRLNQVCDILKEKKYEEEERCSLKCKLHGGKQLDFICYECRMAVCNSCVQTKHASHLCLDPRGMMDHAIERKEGKIRSCLSRISQLQGELDKNRDSCLDVIKDFTRRFEFAQKQMISKVEKVYEEKSKTIKQQQGDVFACMEGIRSVRQNHTQQESVDVHLVVQNLMQLPLDDTFQPKIASLLQVKMDDGFMDKLFSDEETKCGKVVTAGIPHHNKCEVQVMSKDVITKEEMKMQIILNDESGRVVKSEPRDVINVEILTVEGERSPLEVQTVAGGIFQVSYTPSFVGWYKVTVKVYDKHIANSPLQIRVAPKGRELKQIQGESPFLKPHDVLKVGKNFLVIDSCIKLVNGGGKLIQSFPNYDWYFYPYSVAYHGQAYYVTAMKGQVVIKYSPNGKEIKRFGAKHLKKPTGIAINQEGNIYVADSQLSTILVFSPDGEFLRYIQDTSSSGASGFCEPWFIKFNSKGQLVVADCGNKCFHVLDFKHPNEGMSVYVVHNGKSMNCRGIEVDLHDNVYVAARDSESRFECIMVYAPDGTFISSFADSPKGEGLGFARGIHYVSEEDGEFLYVIDGDKKCVREFQL